MKIPGYPSNREADEGAQGHCQPWREGAPQYDAKPVDLFIRHLLGFESCKFRLFWSVLSHCPEICLEGPYTRVGILIVATPR